MRITRSRALWAATLIAWPLCGVLGPSGLNWQGPDMLAAMAAAGCPVLLGLGWVRRRRQAAWRASRGRVLNPRAARTTEAPAQPEWAAAMTARLDALQHQVDGMEGTLAAVVGEPPAATTLTLLKGGAA